MACDTRGNLGEAVRHLCRVRSRHVGEGNEGEYLYVGILSRLSAEMIYYGSESA